MVNKKHENKNQEDLEITNEDIEINVPDLEEVEAREVDIIKSLRDKLKVCEGSKRESLEEMQRVKADFLNARKRLEEERYKDRDRAIVAHVERLLPLADSFQLAIADKATWEKADANWRRGIEGIYSQLQNILSGYGVKTIDPTGQPFNPHKHEALSMVPVSAKDEHDKVVGVVQMGYELQKADGTTEQIRPARVAIGNYEAKN